MPFNHSRKANSVLLPAGALIMQAPVSIDDHDDSNDMCSGKASHDLSQSQVVIDVTKKEVTPYDGGKTTVLTGGVMLGCKPGVTLTPPTPTPSTPRFSSTASHINNRKGNWTRAPSQRLRF